MRQLSENGFKALEREEGLRLIAYLCKAKKWTIGYGNRFYENGKAVKKGDIITLQRAKEIANYHLSKIYDCIENYIIVNINQNQFDALVSFIYNIGIDGFKRSSLLKKINRKADAEDIYKSFLIWNTISNKRDEDLEKRRIREFNLFNANQDLDASTKV